MKEPSIGGTAPPLVRLLSLETLVHDLSLRRGELLSLDELRFLARVREEAEVQALAKDMTPTKLRDLLGRREPQVEPHTPAERG